MWFLQEEKNKNMHPGYAGMTMLTCPKTIKGAPTIHKLTRLTVQLCDYASTVNRRMIAEGIDGHFVAQQLWKGKGRYIGNHIVEHIKTKKKYVAYMQIGQVHEVRWFLNGLEVPKESVEQFLKPSKESNRQPQKKKVKWRTVKVKNLLSLRQDGMDILEALKIQLLPLELRN